MSETKKTQSRIGSSDITTWTPRRRTIKLPIPKVRKAFDRGTLARVCEADESSFGDAYEMTRVEIPSRRAPDNFYFFKDNGSQTLAVAHLDTVGLAHERTCRFVDSEDGPVVFSRALDDRLGAYIILELLPALGVTHDILLTVGEESGRSTASFFEPSKSYDWMIEFDRGGTDVVMYQYEDQECYDLVCDSGARMGMGSFSDIAYLEHLGVKGFNWGVGYEDYHGPRAHAFLEDTFSMVAKYLRFHEVNAGTLLPHEPEDSDSWLLYSDDENENDPFAIVDAEVVEPTVDTDHDDVVDDFHPTLADRLATWKW